ncbi:MAG: deoxyribonuclease IV [Acidimicrobiales bacterium]
MLIGAHVSSSGGLLKALERGHERDADVIQIFTQSPRMWKSHSHSKEALAEFRVVQADDEMIRATFCHASYLINLASTDKALVRRSHHALVENLVAASEIGSAGVVLHAGSHRGAGIDGAIAPVAALLVVACDEASAATSQPLAPLLLENTAGAGGTIGRSFEELARILEAAKGDARIGFCLDTQHLFASGVSFANRHDADATVDRFDEVLGLDRLGCIHLNESKVPFGANRDRHENLDEGKIGKIALGWLLSHDALDHVPAVLEVPGSGHGPRREDVDEAKRIYAAGRKRRRAG